MLLPQRKIPIHKLNRKYVSIDLHSTVARVRSGDLAKRYRLHNAAAERYEQPRPPCTPAWSTRQPPGMNSRVPPAHAGNRDAHIN